MITFAFVELIRLMKFNASSMDKLVKSAMSKSLILHCNTSGFSLLPRHVGHFLEVTTRSIASLNLFFSKH